MSAKIAKKKGGRTAATTLYTNHHWFVNDAKELIVVLLPKPGEGKVQNLKYFFQVSYKTKQRIKQANGESETRNTFTFEVGRKICVVLQTHFCVKKPGNVPGDTVFHQSFFKVIEKINKNDTKGAACKFCSPSLAFICVLIFGLIVLRLCAALLKKLVTEDESDDEKASDAVWTPIFVVFFILN